MVEKWYVLYVMKVLLRWRNTILKPCTTKHFEYKVTGQFYDSNIFFNWNKIFKFKMETMQLLTKKSKDLVSAVKATYLVNQMIAIKLNLFCFWWIISQWWQFKEYCILKVECKFKVLMSRFTFSCCINYLAVRNYNHISINQCISVCLWWNYW